jgi:hypothetical protein
MRLWHEVTQELVDQYKFFIDWVWEWKDREKYDWSFCTYCDNEPYVNVGWYHTRFSQYVSRREIERKYNEQLARKAKLKPKKLKG